MSDAEFRERCKQYVRQWEENAPLLQAIRDRETREADTATSIRMLDQFFRLALRDLPPRDYSGLVEWQKYVMRWRSRD